MTPQQARVNLAGVTTPRAPATAKRTSTDSPQRWSTWRLAAALAAIGLIAVAALIVGVIDLTRTTSTTSGEVHAPVSKIAPPTYTAEQVARAMKDLCSAYDVAARSVKADTNNSDTAIARISLTNAAGMLDAAAENPALRSNARDAARALAAAYRTTNAVSSVSDKASPLFQMTIDDANRADAVMAAACR